MKYVLFYESPAEARAKAPAHFADHRTRFEAFHAQGSLLMCGPFNDDEGGALVIFTSRSAAEEFVRGDPFVLKGVVTRWHIREWNEVLTPIEAR